MFYNLFSMLGPKAKRLHQSLLSLHFKASMQGGTVARPVFFEFPGDVVAPSLSHQFMWGPAILVIPVVNPVR